MNDPFDVICPKCEYAVGDFLVCPNCQTPVKLQREEPDLEPPTLSVHVKDEIQVDDEVR